MLTPPLAHPSALGMSPVRAGGEVLFMFEVVALRPCFNLEFELESRGVGPGERRARGLGDEGGGGFGRIVPGFC